MEVTINAFQTAWGWVGMAASAAGLLRIILPVGSREAALAAVRRDWPGAQVAPNSHLATLQSKLERYFRGEDVSFRDEALDMQQATEFLARVWDVVRAIPRGQVRCYRDACTARAIVLRVRWPAVTVRDPADSRARV